MTGLSLELCANAAARAKRLLFCAHNIIRIYFLCSTDHKLFNFRAPHSYSPQAQAPETLRPRSRWSGCCTHIHMKKV